MQSDKSQLTDSLHLPFTLCRAAGSNQWTTHNCPFYFYSYVEWQVLTNEQLVYIFYYMSSSRFQPTNSSYLFFYLNFMSSSKFQPTNNHHYPYLTLSYSKRQVLTNEHLALSFLPYVEWQVLTNGQLEFAFLPLSYAKWQVRTNEQLAITLHFLISVIPNVSSLNYWSEQYDSRQSFSQWNYITPSEVGSLSQRIWVSRCCFSFQPSHLRRPASILASWAFHSILGQKWCTLYLSLFHPSNQKFHFSNLQTKKLK